MLTWTCGMVTSTVLILQKAPTPGLFSLSLPLYANLLQKLRETRGKGSLTQPAKFEAKRSKNPPKYILHNIFVEYTLALSFS